MEALQSFKPDVAVVSCASDEGDGVATVKSLRSSPAFGSRPIALIVSPGFDRSLLADLTFEAIGFSPVTLERLWALLLACGVAPTIKE